MNKNYNINNPIFANITSIFASSVILIRLSGEYEKIKKVLNFFSIPPLKPRVATLCKLKIKDEILDEAIITYFKAPYSFTGEEVLEIAIHGSKFIFNKISEVLFSLGFNFALNGEFSFRAFMNGKMDLVEAEGMANLIASETELQHKVAMRQFEGEKSKIFQNLKSELIEVLSFIESLIDFSDEDLPKELEKTLKNKVENVKNIISDYLENSSALSLQEGLKIAIIGRPNAGKSSLFNKITNTQKAIVSNISGTTRDVIEERIILKGIPIIFYDTAGITKNTQDEIELEGIKRAIKTLEKSDIKLLVNPANSGESFENLSKDLNFEVDENTIFVLTKCDLINNFTKENNVCKISINIEETIKNLIQKIENTLEKNFLSLLNSALIGSERQKILLTNALIFLEKFNFQKEIELAGEDLKQAANALQNIIGTIDVEDILGSIFSKFCIGK